MDDVRHRSQLDWYARHAPMTSLGEHAAAADCAMADSATAPALAERIQGMLIHPFHAERYGVPVGPDTERQLQNRSAHQLLSELLAIDPAPLGEPRPPAKRTFGNCRHFATLLTSLLRERGVPARSRCGFGAYFEPGKYADHWVTETWNEADQRWQLVDAQIDGVQRDGMNIQVDTLDLGREDFWVAGQAWSRCRRGEQKPEDFGILDMWGRWFIRDNVVRDLAALCKVELLPWDAWGLMLTPDEEMDAEEIALIDRVAELTTAEVPDVAAIRELYSRDDRLRVPSTIVSYRPAPGPVEIGGLSQG